MTSSRCMAGEEEIFDALLPEAPGWVAAITDLNEPETRNKRPLAISALISTTMFSSLGYLVAEKCMEHGFDAFASAFVFAYAVLATTIAQCEFLLGKSGRRSANSAFTHFSVASSGIGSLLACGFLFRLTSLSIRNALTISAGVSIILSATQPLVLCTEYTGCQNLTGIKPCLKYRPDLTPECSALTSTAVTHTKQYRATSLISLLTDAYVNHGSSAWQTSVQIIVIFALASFVLPNLLRRFPRQYICIFVGTALLLVLILFLSLVNHQTLLPITETPSYWPLVCDALLLASMTLFLGTGILTEFGAALKQDRTSDIKFFIIVCVCLVYTLFFAAAVTLTYAVESNSVGRVNGEDTLFWPIWAKFGSKTAYFMTCGFVTLLYGLMGTMCTSSVVLFYPMFLPNDVNSTKSDIAKGCIWGLAIALIALGGAGGTLRIIDRSGHLVTSAAACLQLAIIAHTRFTGSNVFKFRLPKNSTSSKRHSKGTWTDLYVSFVAYFAFPVSIILLSASVFRLIQPFSADYYERMIRELPLWPVQSLLILLPFSFVVLVALVRGVVLMLLARRGRITAVAD